MDFLRVENVNKSFSNHQALKDVSINVPENSIFGLLGPNGAGKTTLIRIINQITAPDSGRVFINNQPLAQQHCDIIGYLPEERGLYKKMTVGEQSLYLAQLKGLSLSEAKKRLKYWFLKFEIDGWWNKKVEELSKGMQQKIQFVVTILHQPKLLIFDEPFSGFDPINAQLLKEEILNLKANGSTIIFSTHNMASVEEICDDIALINKSQKILEGNVQQIRNNMKKNIFEISYKQQEKEPQYFLPINFEIQNHVIEHGSEKLRVKLPFELDANHLLEKMIQHVKVIGLEEIIPSMNDIFIEEVSKNKSLQ